MASASAFKEEIAEYGIGIHVEIRTGRQNKSSCLWPTQEAEAKAMGLPCGLQTLACTASIAFDYRIKG